MNNRHLLTLIIILLITWGANWFLDKEEKDQSPDSVVVDEPDSYMINATITQFNDQGIVQHIITAEEFVHFSVSDITKLVKPDIQLFENEKPEPWEINSENGQINPKNNEEPETLELWGNVLTRVSSGEDRFTDLKSEKIKIIPDLNLVEALANVYITNEVGTTKAGGFVASLKENKFELFSSVDTRVESTFLIEKDSH